MTARTDAVLLQALLAAEHAAVFGYGVLGARLAGPQRLAAQTAENAHRARRDDLTARLRALGQTPVATRPSYDVATPGQAEALALAVRLEEGMAVRWRDLAGGTVDKELRALGIAGLTETAVQAAQWRLTQGVPAPGVTVGLPGVG